MLERSKDSQLKRLELWLVEEVKVDEIGSILGVILGTAANLITQRSGKESSPPAPIPTDLSFLEAFFYSLFIERP